MCASFAPGLECVVDPVIQNQQGPMGKVLRQRGDALRDAGSDGVVSVCHCVCDLKVGGAAHRSGAIMDKSGRPRVAISHPQKPQKPS